MAGYADTACNADRVHGQVFGGQQIDLTIGAGSL